MNDVLIALPMYVNLDQMQINERVIKQAIGRVGRANKVGHAHIIELYGIG